MRQIWECQVNILVTFQKWYKGLSHFDRIKSKLLLLSFSRRACCITAKLCTVRTQGRYSEKNVKKQYKKSLAIFTITSSTTALHLFVSQLSSLELQLDWSGTRRNWYKTNTTSKNWLFLLQLSLNRRAQAVKICFVSAINWKNWRKTGGAQRTRKRRSASTHFLSPRAKTGASGP